MLFHAGLSKRYWAEAIATAAYVRNRLPTTAHHTCKSPHEVWYGHKPDISHLRVFSCTAYAHIPRQQRQKLDKRCEKLRFVGYSTVSKGNRLLDESTNTIYTRRDVVFKESDFGHTQTSEADSGCNINPTSSVITVAPLTDESTEIQDKSTSIQSTRTSQRHRQPPVRYGIDEYVAAAGTQRVGCITEPSNLSQATSSRNAAEWLEAAESKYRSLMKNKAWTLVPLPNGRSVIGCKWVL